MGQVHTTVSVIKADVGSLAGHVKGRHGPFEPHLLHPEELEYTTLPQVTERLKKRFEPVE